MISSCVTRIRLHMRIDLVCIICRIMFSITRHSLLSLAQITWNSRKRTDGSIKDWTGQTLVRRSLGQKYLARQEEYRQDGQDDF